MGKSIVHCSVCGKRVTEEDFAGRKAVTSDYRTYCSTCVPPELAPRQQPQTPRPGSTARIPVAGQTPRRGTPVVAARKPPMALLAGIGVAVIAIAVVAVVLSGGRKAPPPEPEPVVKAPVPRPREAPRPTPTPEAPKETPPAIPPTPPVDVKPPPEVPKEKPAPAPETPQPVAPVISFPADGTAFEEPATVAISVDTPGDPVKVEFFEGVVKIGEATERPFRMAWKDVPAGAYPLTARATAKDGERVSSASISIRVLAPAAPAPAAEDRKPPPPGALPADRRVDDAIAKGIKFLKSTAVKSSMDPTMPTGLSECPELILLTMVHARVPENDPDFVKLFNYVVNRKLEKVYYVSLHAMILEELNRVKYQSRIAQCAQFLLDAQCGNGQWSYTGPVQAGVATSSLKLEVPTGAVADGPRVKPKVVRKITTVKKLREGPPTGDNSNSQYAALGLRACSEAGIVIPSSVVLHAQTWWRISQHDPEGVEKGRVASSDGTVPAGWCYTGRDQHVAYAAMTAGAVGALAIWNFLEDEQNWQKDATLRRGMAWLGRHFSVTSHEGPSEHIKDTGWMLYYYLYALERAGVLSGAETFGGRNWYGEGSEAILKAQRADGSWLSPKPHDDRSDTANATWDTCFAILFLKRATRPLVASTDIRK